MTSIEWLMNELYTEMNLSGSGRVLDEILEEAKQKHKEEITDAHLDGQSLVSCKDEYAEQYYNETFKNPKKDEITFGDLRDVDVDSYMKGYNKVKEPTSSQTEISDDEIEKWAKEYTCKEYEKLIFDYENYDTYGDFVNGAKKYREQIKLK